MGKSNCVATEIKDLIGTHKPQKLQDNITIMIIILIIKHIYTNIQTEKSISHENKSKAAFVSHVN